MLFNICCKQLHQLLQNNAIKKANFFIKWRKDGVKYLALCLLSLANAGKPLVSVTNKNAVKVTYSIIRRPEKEDTIYK